MPHYDLLTPPLGMWITSHGQCPMSKGGGVLVNVQEWGCLSIFRRADDVTRAMSKGGGCLWMSSPPPPFRKSCIRACVPPIQVQTPPPPPGWLRACYGKSVLIFNIRNKVINLPHFTPISSIKIAVSPAWPVNPLESMHCIVLHRI